jgi:hypothetical protein
MPKIHVLKPFVFSSLPPNGSKLPVERHFAKGVKDIDEAMANHPWIRDEYADGHIERPEQARARLRAAAIAAKQAADEAAQVNRLAEEAIARTVAQSGTTASNEEIERELNTPANELQRQRGAALDLPETQVSVGDVKAPVDRLADSKGDAEGKKKR